MDVVIISWSQNSVQTLSLTQRATQQPSDPQLSHRQDIPQLCGKAKTGAAIQSHRSTKTERKGDERVKGMGTEKVGETERKRER